MVDSNDNKLTNRERDVLIYVARGYTNTEIADQLCTSTSAVKVFLYQAYRKLGARNRAQAVVTALKRCAIGPQDLFSQDELVELLMQLGSDSITLIGQLVKQRQEALSEIIGLVGIEAIQVLAKPTKQKQDESTA